MRPPPARTPRGRTGRPSARFPPTARKAGTAPPRERELRGPGRARRLPERLPGQGSRLGTPRRAVNGRGAPRRALPEKRPAPARKNAPGSPSENRKKTGRPGRREPAPVSGNSGAPASRPDRVFRGIRGSAGKARARQARPKRRGPFDVPKNARGPVPCRKDGRGRGGAGDSREAR